MYRHSGFSRSWSSLFGRPAHGGILTNENRSEGDLPLAEENNAKTPEEHEKDHRYSRRRRMGLRSSSSRGNECQNHELMEFDDKIPQNESQVSLDPELNHGHNPYIMMTSSESNFANYPVISSDIENYSVESSPDRNERSDVDKTERTLSDSKGGSSLRMRERISNAFGKSKRDEDDDAKSKKEEDDEGIALMESRLSNLPRQLFYSVKPNESPVDTVNSSTPLPKLVKRKSNLKLSSIITSFQKLENEIIDKNPNIEGVQLFPTPKNLWWDTRRSNTVEGLAFDWIVWEPQDNGLNAGVKIETPGDAVPFINGFRGKLFSEKPEVHILRRGLKPSRKSRQLLEAGTLELRVPFKDERKFTVWQYLTHLVLSDSLYSSDNIHEPIVGLSWHCYKENDVVTLWFSRRHSRKSEQELLELSRVCYFLRDSLPEEVREIIEEENMIYSLNKTNKIMPITFLE